MNATKEEEEEYAQAIDAEDHGIVLATKEHITEVVQHIEKV